MTKHISGWHAVLILLPALAVTSCAGPGAPPTSSDLGRMDPPELYSAFRRADVPPHMTVIDAPVERVAAEVPDVYLHLGLIPGPTETEPEEPIFGTPTLRIKGQLYEGERNSDYLDCGESGPGGKRADMYEVQFAVYTRLRSDDEGGTIVETLINGAAYRQGVNPNSAVRCTGTGRLERMIADLLRRRAGG